MKSGSGSFLKKRTKNPFPLAHALRHRAGQIIKSFLVLFFKKALLSSKRQISAISTPARPGLAQCDRHDAFKRENFEQLIDAMAGLLVVISSQFRTETCSAAVDAIPTEGAAYHDFSPAIGTLFRIEFPDDWPAEEKYDFDWQMLCREQARFCKIDYDRITV